MINFKDHLGETPLHHAARNGHTSVTQELLKKPRLNLHCVNKKGQTPLHLAARFGHHSIISVLLSYDRALANAKDLNGETALHEASRSGHTSVVIELLQYDTTSISEENTAGAEPIHIAILSHHLRIIRMLLNKRHGYSLHRSSSRVWKPIGDVFLVSQKSNRGLLLMLIRDLVYLHRDCILLHGSGDVATDIWCFYHTGVMGWTFLSTTII